MNKTFGEAFPDSACLIVVGLLLGEALRQLNVDRNVFSLESHIFFLYLLPPIIFDAGYFMPNRQLFDNLDSVMVFAFIGTIYNTVAISTTLYICGSYGLFSVEFSLFEILLFAALISAVDPVAVIAGKGFRCSCHNSRLHSSSFQSSRKSMSMNSSSSMSSEKRYSTMEPPSFCIPCSRSSTTSGRRILCSSITPPEPFHFSWSHSAEF